MKNISFKLVSLTLVFIMILSFVGCGADNANNDNNSRGTENTITVTDMSGNNVKIPSDTKNNTVATTYGVITPFYVTLHMSDRVLATTVKNKGFMRKVDETIVKTGDIGNLTIDAEALASYNPNILMVRSSEAEKKAVGEKLKIPTVAVYIETADQVVEAYQLLGTMFGCENRANELITYINNELIEIDKLAKTIPDEKKKTAVCMGSELGQIAGQNMLQVEMIERAGGKSEVTDVADDMMWVNVGVEKVFSYNPDYIFVSSSNPLDYKCESLSGDAAWSGMKAIENSNIYLIPAKLDSWDMPGPAFVLGTYYMMHCMYPQLVSSEMLQNKVNEFYNLFYGKTFTGEELGYSF